jgi:predicted dehydrogenase
VTRVGIAGYGLAGEVFHAPLVEAVDGLEVTGIVTTDPARTERARAAFPRAAVVPSLDPLWDEIDLLVVATPNRSHVDLALAAVERGKAVVVDKPLASSVADAERLLAAGGAVTVFQNRRWDGDFLTVRRLVAEGALGDVVRLESRFDRFRPDVSADAWRELPDAAEGGGLLLDLGAHLVDQARELLGHPRRVYAEVDRRRPGAQVDDDVFVALEHPGGARSHLWMSAVAPVHDARFRVNGTRAGLTTRGLDPQEPQLRAGRRPRDPDYGHGADGVLVDADGERRVRLDRGAYQEFYVRVRDWLEADGPVPVDPADSLAGLRILEAARRSAVEHTIVEVVQR